GWRAWGGGEGAGRGSGALNSWADVAGFGLLLTNGGPGLELQRPGDIRIPAVDVGTELNLPTVPEGGVIQQAHRDLLGQLDEAFLIAGQRFREVVGHVLILGNGARELQRVFNPDAAV